MTYRTSLLTYCEAMILRLMKQTANRILSDPARRYLGIAILGAFTDLMFKSPWQSKGYA